MTINTTRPQMFTDDAVDAILPFELHIVFSTGHQTVVIKGTHDTASGSWDYDTPEGFGEGLQSQVELVIELAIADFSEIGKPAGDFDDTYLDDEYFSGFWMLIKGEQQAKYLGN